MTKAHLGIASRDQIKGCGWSLDPPLYVDSTVLTHWKWNGNSDS